MLGLKNKRNENNRTLRYQRNINRGKKEIILSCIWGVLYPCDNYDGYDIVTSPGRKIPKS